MNVRKIIFSVLSMMLVLRPFDVWGYSGCEYVAPRSGSAGQYGSVYGCDTKDKLAGRSVTEIGYDSYIVILGGGYCFKSNSYGSNNSDRNFEWSLLRCEDNRGDLGDDPDDTFWYSPLSFSGDLNTCRYNNQDIKKIKGANYQYSGCGDFYFDGTDRGKACNYKEGKTYVDVSCPDGHVYDGTKCTKYSDLNGSCAPINVPSLSTKVLKPGDVEKIDDFLCEGDENIDAKRFLKNKGLAGAGYVCRLKKDQYVAESFKSVLSSMCTDENEPIFDPAEKSTVHYKCDETEGWIKTIITNCGDEVTFEGQDRLLGLENESNVAKCNDVPGCKAGWYKEKNCGYLYCDQGYVPSHDKKTCLTRNELNSMIQEGEQTAETVFNHSLDACKKQFQAYKADKNKCTSSGGTVSADTSKTKWNGPKCVEDEKECKQADIEADWLVDSDRSIITSNNVQEKAKVIKECTYEIGCDCDKDKYLVNPSNDDDYCQCLDGYVPEDSNNMAAGCKQGSQQDCRVAEAAQGSFKIKPKWDGGRCVCVYDDYASGGPDIKYYVLDSDYKCVPTIDLAICLPLIANKHAEWDNSVGKCKCLKREDLDYYFVNGQCLETQESVMAREIELSERRLGAIRESNQTVYDKYDAMISPIRERAKDDIGDAYAKLEELRGDFKTSVWKNKEGKFNTARLLSDSVAGIALGTVGGVVTHNVVEKNQLEDGFEDLKCTVAGQEVARFDEVFQAGIQ